MQGKIKSQLSSTKTKEIIDNIKSLGGQCTPLGGTDFSEYYTLAVDGKVTKISENGLGCKEAQSSISYLKTLN